MSLKIKDFLLTGPFAVDETVIRANQDPAVFAVVIKGGEPWNPTFKVIDVGDSGDAGMNFSQHPHLAEWRQAAGGKVGLYLLTFSRKDGRTTADRLATAEAIRESLKATGGMIPIQGSM